MSLWSMKNVAVNFCQCLWEILTDFNNFCTAIKRVISLTCNACHYRIHTSNTCHHHVIMTGISCVYTMMTGITCLMVSGDARCHILRVDDVTCVYAMTTGITCWQQPTRPTSATSVKFVGTWLCPWRSDGSSSMSAFSKVSSLLARSYNLCFLFFVIQSCNYCFLELMICSTINIL